jgi:hypothetical protein
VICLEEYSRRGTSLDYSSGSVRLFQRAYGDDSLCGKQQYREQRVPVAGHRCVLYEEKDQTVRMRRCMVSLGRMPVMGVRVFLGVQCGEVMHAVWTRYRQQREERQEYPERDDVHVPSVSGQPVVWAIVPEGLHRCKSVLTALRAKGTSCIQTPGPHEITTAFQALAV